MVLDATPGQWHEIERHSAIVLQDRLVPYPFQMHLGHAPSDVRDECLAELPSEAQEFDVSPEELNFADWVAGSLGTGIGRHFMVPYNEKLSTVRAGELTCEWLGRFVPRPSLEQIREGAASERVVQTGYNQRFLYPKEGGISLLWKVLAAGVQRISTRARVVGVDTTDRMVLLESGERVRYREGVISSVPLPEMADLVRPLSPEFGHHRELRANAVTCVNVGLKRTRRDFE